MALARIGHPCNSTAGCRATRRRHWSTPRSSPSALGVGKVFVKDESSRLGLPAFKVLGASWAVYRALEERLGEGFGDWEEIGELEERLEPMRPLSLVAATDGNHGRAVARVARLLGLGAKIFVPDDMVPARRKSIAEEGAEVIVVDGTYDEAVERSAAEEGESTLLVSDMSWPGYERIPSWVIEGYSTMLWEIDDALEEEKRRRTRPRGRAGRRRRLRRRRGPPLPQSRSVAAPEAHERRAGERGLPARVGRCRTPRVRARAARFHHVGSKLRQALTGRLADRIQGHRPPRRRRRRPAREAMRLAAESGIESGETGAAGLGGLLELLRAGEEEEVRRALGVGEETRVLLFNCEGATDRRRLQEDNGGLASYFPYSLVRAGLKPAPTTLHPNRPIEPFTGFGKTTLRRRRGHAAPHWLSPLSSRPRSVAGGAGRG